MKENLIKELFKLSEKSFNNDEFPVGAIITYNNKIISRGYNNRNKSKITYDHAEIMAIRKANVAMSDWRLSDCEMYVTLEPCEMCKKVIAESRIRKVYFLISKNLDKLQFKGTKFMLLDREINQKYSNNFTNYEKMLSDFFVDKRW